MVPIHDADGLAELGLDSVFDGEDWVFDGEDLSLDGELEVAGEDSFEGLAAAESFFAADL